MKVAEIFQSIDGEVNYFSQGRISTFIRFAGCNLDCLYCDTPATKKTENGNFKEMSIDDILIEVNKLGGSKITLTGGEPLIQEEIYSLIERLYLDNYNISIETNGSKKIMLHWLKKVYISWIVDFKLDFPERMETSNWKYLTNKDWIKFPIKNIEDIQQAIEIKNEILEESFCSAQFAISPIIDNEIKKGEIKKFINYLIGIKEFDFVINLQLHKFINIQ